MTGDNNAGPIGTGAVAARHTMDRAQARDNSPARRDACELCGRVGVLRRGILERREPGSVDLMYRDRLMTVPERFATVWRCSGECPEDRP